MKLVWEIAGVGRSELDVTGWKESAIAAYEDELHKLFKYKVLIWRVKDE